MKKSRFSEEEKIAILKEVRAGGTVVATCAKHNIGVQTYHGWKRKFGGMEVDEARRLRALEEDRHAQERSGAGCVAATTTKRSVVFAALTFVRARPVLRICS